MSTWGIGNKINLMPRDSTSIAMQKNTKASSWTVKNTAEEYIITKVELLMMDSGTRIGKMDSVFTTIQMVKNTKETG